MQIMISGLSMAYDNAEDSAEVEAKRVAQQFGVIVVITKRHGDGGWPEVNVIGTPQQITKMYLEGWSCGDETEDHEMLYHYLKDAQEVYGA